MRVLLIGAGGLGCAVGVALRGALGAAGEDVLVTVIDPDRVEASNLQRQVLYSDRDLGAPKAERAARALGPLAARAIVGRFDVESAIALASAHDLVIEGTDRHETKFLAADACVLAGTPIVHAGVVGWAGWAMACRPRQSACLRCVFEEIPRGAAIASCTEDGVVGAVVGVLGALQASLAAGVLAGAEGAAGTVLRYDARAGVARSSRVRRREDCALCGEAPAIRGLDEARYAPVCPA